MRLIDFNLSTADLDRQLPLYWEHDHTLVPIQSLALTANQLILNPVKNSQPMLLDQFATRTQQVSGQINLFVQTTEQPAPIFGYRLNEQRMLLG